METSKKKWDILGLGCVAVDDLRYLDSFPQPDTKHRVRQRQRQCGGLTGNALVAAARLGARCAFGGTLGTDEASQFVLDTFRREGIDVSTVRILPEARPIRSTILVDQRQHTRTVLFDLSGTMPVSEDWPPEEVIRASSIVYVDHYGIDGMIRAAQISHSAGGTVVADLERNEWPRFDELLALVDHVIVSQSFARKWSGCSDSKAATEKLWSPDRSAVVVTCGPDGCWWIADSSKPVQHQPAFTIDVVDTTGCGDIFHGAYAATLVRGLPLLERVRLASAAAAIKATKPGGQGGSPTWAELMEFLASKR